jgi:hypothetical protein
VDGSPIDKLMAAIDVSDVDAAMALFGPAPRLMTVDARRADGSEAVRELLVSFLGSLRSCRHAITAQWHPDDVWIAEVDASYELQDGLEITHLPRVFVARMESGLITDLRGYGAHEHQLTDHRTADAGIWIGGHWIPPL